MKKHIFFDLDNTLTRSRSPITPSMLKLLRKLSQSHDVIVVSGADKDQIARQLGNGMKGKYLSMGQNGNACIDRDSTLLWEKRMSWIARAEVYAYALRVYRNSKKNFKDPMDLISDRGCQISYSFIGHHEDVSKKEAFDPDSKIRRAVLNKSPFKSDEVDVRIGGTTCLDFFMKGSHKGANIATLLRMKKWKKSECLYVGDCLFPGGNDETVIGVIPTKAVRDPSETETVITQLIS
jgi:phosphomannomutase